MHWNQKASQKRLLAGGLRKTRQGPGWVFTSQEWWQIRWKSWTSPFLIVGFVGVSFGFRVFFLGISYRYCNLDLLKVIGTKVTVKSNIPNGISQMVIRGDHDRFVVAFATHVHSCLETMEGFHFGRYMINIYQVHHIKSIAFVFFPALGGGKKLHPGEIKSLLPPRSLVV